MKLQGWQVQICRMDIKFKSELGSYSRNRIGHCLYGWGRGQEVKGRSTGLKWAAKGYLCKGFLTSAWLAFGARQFFVDRVYPRHCRMFWRKQFSPPELWQPKMSPNNTKCPPGTKSSSPQLKAADWLKGFLLTLWSIFVCFLNFRHWCFRARVDNMSYGPHLAHGPFLSAEHHFHRWTFAAHVMIGNILFEPPLCEMLS